MKTHQNVIFLLFLAMLGAVAPAQGQFRLTAPTSAPLVVTEPCEEGAEVKDLKSYIGILEFDAANLKLQWEQLRRVYALYDEAYRIEREKLIDIVLKIIEADAHNGNFPSKGPLINRDSVAFFIENFLFPGYSIYVGFDPLRGPLDGELSGRFNTFKAQLRLITEASNNTYTDVSFGVLYRAYRARIDADIRAADLKQRLDALLKVIEQMKFELELQLAQCSSVSSQ